MIISSLIWFGLAAFFLIIEMGHPGLLFFLSLACGSLAAGVLALLAYSSFAQIWAFWAITIAIFLLLKIFLRKMHRPIKPTNIDSLIHKEGIVTEPISLVKPGYVRIENEIWFARPSSDIEIPKNAVVRVVAVRGAHVVVKQKE